MKLVHAPYAASALLLLALVGCKIRYPVGGCPYRDPPPSQYYAEAEITPIEDFAPGLVPMEEHDVEAIFAWIRWAYDTGNLHAEFEYRGQTNDSPTTGHGSFRNVAEFVPAD